MLNPTLRVVLLIGILIYYVALYRFICRRRFLLKYTLLWIILGMILLLMAVFPEMLYFVSRRIGIAAPVNALFFSMIVMVIMILLSLTAICSGLSDKTRGLVQEVAILEKRIRDLEERNGRKTDDTPEPEQDGKKKDDSPEL